MTHFIISFFTDSPTNHKGEWGPLRSNIYWAAACKKWLCSGFSADGSSWQKNYQEQKPGLLDLNTGRIFCPSCANVFYWNKKTLIFLWRDFICGFTHSFAFIQFYYYIILYYYLFFHKKMTSEHHPTESCFGPFFFPHSSEEHLVYVVFCSRRTEKTGWVKSSILQLLIRVWTSAFFLPQAELDCACVSFKPVCS